MGYATILVDSLAIFLGCAGFLILGMGRAITSIRPLERAVWSSFFLLYTVGLASFLARVLFVVDGGASQVGSWLFIWLLLTTKFSDMGAYLTGSLLGRHKMIPHISPAKTWEGFVGALCFSSGGGLLLFFIKYEQLVKVFARWEWVLIVSLVLSVLAVLGDLAESLIKRSLSCKDSGGSLPGIGGALDLLDSLLFSAPGLFAFLFIKSLF